jgi:hypothetical protein
MRKTAAEACFPQQRRTKREGMELEPVTRSDAPALVNECHHCRYRWVPRGLSRSARCPACTRRDWYVRPGTRNARFKAVIDELTKLDQEDAGLIPLRNEVVPGPSEAVPLQALLDYGGRLGRRKALHDELRQLAAEV